MAAYHAELLNAARLLVARVPAQRGRLPRARGRRAVSTAYYALFHFVLTEAGRLVVGTGLGLDQRRQLLGRRVTHKGADTAFGKIMGRRMDPEIAPFVGGGPVAPDWTRSLAEAFRSARAEREDADYNLTKSILAENATSLIDQVEQAIHGWQAHDSPRDKDIKKGVMLLVLLAGRLREG